ncbi:pyroglutamyl-peptidase I [Filobacillus milosensis]|uniref:Pyroglutamyl-peptidase I n=1 Tax=Filobacillus milosensis TaxID=94137 RepID=A0A4Y8ILQ9_9BACI|nr:pyroglutamyl-peptidase I [Filobacillus milosensis]TFB15071.1 pyroglutamyl-peptidase I [Filobacillus milosensis]
MSKILLTGFEPFLSFKTNPTMEIAKKLDGQSINQYEVVSRILTVDFNRSGKQMIDAIEEVKPDVIVALGLAGNRKHITPERIAINCNDGPEDNEGNKPNGEKIFEDGPDGYLSTLPIKEMVENITKNGLPASISNTAGTYLCNNVMYHGLHHGQQNNYNYRAGFIHIPPSHDIALQQPSLASWSQDDLNQAVQLALEIL